MSTDPGYMLIRVDLQGAQQAAAEMGELRGAVVGTSEATAASNATAATSATKSSRAGSRASKAWSTAGKAAKVGMLGIVGGAAAIGITGVKAAEHIENLGLVAAGLRRNLDFTAQAGSRWAAVAESRGVQSTALNMAFKTLSQQLVAANDGTETSMDLFKTLGLTQKDVAKGTHDFDFAVTKLADGFGNARGSAVRMNASAKLLGRGYQKLLPLFADGSKGLEEQLGWADKYHIAMGGQAVDDTVALAMAQRESKVAWAGIQHVIGEAFLPILTDAHGEFQEFAKDITDPRLSTDQKFDILGDKLAELAKRLSGLVSQVLPGMISQMADNAPKVAGAFVQGFLGAGIWGKLIIGTWLASRIASSKLLGTVALAAGKVGMKIGSRIALTVLGWVAGTEVGGSLLNMLPVKLTTISKSPKVTSAAKGMGGTLGRSFALGFATFGGILFADLFNDWLNQSGDAQDAIRGFLGIEQNGPTGDTDPGQLDPGGLQGGLLGNLPGSDDSGDEEIDLAPGGGDPMPKVGVRRMGQHPRGRHFETDGGRRDGDGGSDKVEPSDVVMDGEKVGKVMWRRARQQAARR